MPKAKPDQVVVHRIEFQESERELLSSVTAAYSIGRIADPLVKLLNERARSIIRVCEQVEARGEKTFSPQREEQVLRNVLGHNSGPAHDGTIEEIFRSILSAFKKM